MVTLLAAAVLVPLGIGSVALWRAIVANNSWKATSTTATAVVAHGFRPDQPLSTPNRAVDLIQVLDSRRAVLASTPAAAELQPLSDAAPAPGTHANVSTCQADGCFHVTAMRVSESPESAIVVAAQRSPTLLTNGVLEMAAALQVAMLIALAGWATWLVVGRALRPVGEMRVELDEVNVSDLTRRVTVPEGSEEVAGLAKSVNATLAKVEAFAERQRQFASDASHELRTPLAGLRAELESAQLYPDDTEIDALVTKALTDTDRVEDIIADLLLLSRIGSRVDVIKQTVDLAEVASEAASGPQRIPVRLALADGIEVDGIRSQLVRSLTELLANAQRHAATSVAMDLRVQNGQAVITVQNDGPQIPRADRERIFERFARLDGARSRGAGGTGLGLSIARAVAEAHHGTLVVEDSTQGARFVVRLPIRAASVNTDDAMRSARTPGGVGSRS